MDNYITGTTLVYTNVFSWRLRPGFLTRSAFFDSFWIVAVAVFTTNQFSLTSALPLQVVCSDADVETIVQSSSLLRESGTMKQYAPQVIENGASGPLGNIHQSEALKILPPTTMCWRELYQVVIQFCVFPLGPFLSTRDRCMDLESFSQSSHLCYHLFYVSFIVDLRMFGVISDEFIPAMTDTASSGASICAVHPQRDWPICWNHCSSVHNAASLPRRKERGIADFTTSALERNDRQYPR